MGRRRDHSHEYYAEWLVFAFFLLSLGLWIGTLTASPPQEIVSPPLAEYRYDRKYDKFRSAVKSYLTFRESRSPYSIDYEEANAETFLRLRVGALYREWENSVLERESE